MNGGRAVLAIVLSFLAGAGYFAATIFLLLLSSFGQYGGVPSDSSHIPAWQALAPAALFVLGPLFVASGVGLLALGIGDSSWPRRLSDVGRALFMTGIGLLGGFLVSGAPGTDGAVAPFNPAAVSRSIYIGGAIGLAVALILNYALRTIEARGQAT
jgi:hypothetical protein